jgi:hypothetical protein
MSFALTARCALHTSPQPSHIVLDRAGQPLTFGRYFDLGADQCSIAWLSTTELRVTNRCTGEERAVATLSGSPRDVDFAPDGTVLVVTEQHLTRYRMDGSIAASVSDFALRGRLAISPDARTAFIATPNLLFAYDLETDALTRVGFTSVHTITDIAIHGGWTAAGGFPLCDAGVEIPVRSHWLLVVALILAGLARLSGRL